MSSSTTRQPSVDNDDNISIGYISIKDFAYPTSSPLHYGYFDELTPTQSPLICATNNNINDDLNKRQSFLLPNNYIINQKAIALYDFIPENDNELKLSEGDLIYINYKHGQGWLVAQDINDKERIGLVPEEFISYIDEEEESNDIDGATNGQRESGNGVRPFYLTQLITQSMKNVSIDDDDNDNNDNNNNNDNTSNNPTVEDEQWEDIHSDTSHDSHNNIDLAKHHNEV